jgi:hypothetical protein
MCAWTRQAPETHQPLYLSHQRVASSHSSLCADQCLRWQSVLWTRQRAPSADERVAHAIDRAPAARAALQVLQVRLLEAAEALVLHFSSKMQLI